MPQQVGQIVGGHIGGESEFRRDTEADGSHNPSNDVAVEFFPIDNQQARGTKEKERDDVLTDFFKRRKARAFHKADRKYPPVEDGQQQKDANDAVDQEYGSDLEFSVQKQKGRED